MTKEIRSPLDDALAWADSMDYLNPHVVVLRDEVRRLRDLNRLAAASLDAALAELARLRSAAPAKKKDEAGS